MALIRFTGGVRDDNEEFLSYEERIMLFFLVTETHVTMDNNFPAWEFRFRQQYASSQNLIGWYPEQCKYLKDRSWH